MPERTDPTAVPPPPPQINPNNAGTEIYLPECEKAKRKPSETAVELSVLPSDDEIISEKVSGRERLKRHRVDVAGRVWIPDMWGQEGFLKDWVDSSVFDASLVNVSITSARDSLVEQGRRKAVRSTRRKLETA